LQQRGLGLVEQDAPHTAVGRIVGLDRDRAQTGAGPEGSHPDAGDAARDRHVGQPDAPIKCLVPDADDTVGDRDIGQAGAGSKRIGSDVRDAAGIE